VNQLINDFNELIELGLYWINEFIEFIS